MTTTAFFFTNISLCRCRHNVNTPIGHHDTHFCCCHCHHEWVLNPSLTTTTQNIDLFCRSCRSVNEPFTKVVAFRFAIKYTKQRNTTSTLCKKWWFYSSKETKTSQLITTYVEHYINDVSLIRCASCLVLSSRIWKKCCTFFGHLMHEWM